MLGWKLRLIIILLINLFCLNVFSQSTATTSRNLSTAEIQKNLSVILKDVSEIDGPGVPGGLCVFGPQAFAVVTGTTGRKGNAVLPVVAAAIFGQGRIAGLGHTGYFGSESLAKVNTGKLIINLIRWTSGKNSPRIVVIRENQLEAYLKSQQLTVSQGTGQDLSSELKDCDVLCCNSDRFGNDKSRAVVLEFIKKGGGVIATMTGWGWQQLNPKKSLDNDSAGNKVFAEAGIVWSGSMPGRTGQAGFTISGTPSKYCNAITALDTLQAQAAGKITVSKDEISQITTTLSDAVRSIPKENSIFWPGFSTIEARVATSAIPTEKKPIANTDGLAKVVLAYQIHRDQSLPPEQVKAHPAAAAFPGPVPKITPRVSERIIVETIIPRWHSTGLYAAPGELITVTVPESAADGKLLIRIGCHTDGLWNNEKWSRAPEITRKFLITNAVTKAACAFGGLIYIDVPKDCMMGDIPVQISGAVHAPYYILGKTSLQQWRNTIRNYQAPIAELQTDKLIISIPSIYVRDLNDPEPVMKFWDEVLDACADLACLDRNRPSPERFVSDVQISAGYMHSGYPLMSFLDAAPRFIKVDHLRNDGDWGMFHEIGHNHQNGDWTFNGAGEVTVNLFSLYILDTVCPKAPKHGAITLESRTKNMKKYFAEDAQFSKWQSDPFLALIMYVQLREAFGWDAFKKVIGEYRKLGSNEHPKNDEEKRDQWMVRFSRAIGKNLGPFFQAWNVPTSESARSSIADLPKWMPDNFPPRK
ncbi:MAG: M60 family metallopeptidase [Kiritimatiellae bacterium]|nr:M60 family metallopeptidase [Kiritimatiellia bacterium]MDD5522362.1 M60 family metallopeptidase [Kiritimatiellia bacterium]